MTINNKINNILALALTSHGGGGYLNHNKKNYSERRNHGLSLTNLTHCISPSNCDNYYNNDSFNKINLQLHASSNKVSNPYSFSIKSNTKFSAVAQSVLPTTATLLLEITNENLPFIGTFTVPSYCKVVRTQIFDRPGRAISLTHQSNNMVWNQITVGTGTSTTFIGVTPGKEYSLILDAEDTDYAWARIWYSAEINTHTPDVEDY